MHHNPPNSDTAEPLADYTPVALAPRREGWTAERQRKFLQALAESGRVSVAAVAVGLSVRSAYRLRRHPQGRRFAEAWDAALYCGANRLIAVALERATVGGYREVWKDGKIQSEVRAPSDRLLVFLLEHLAPHVFSKELMRYRENPVAAAEIGFANRLAELADVTPESVPTERLTEADYAPAPHAPREQPVPKDPFTGEDYDWGDDDEEDEDWADEE